MWWDIGGGIERFREGEKKTASDVNVLFSTLLVCVSLFALCQLTLKDKKKKKKLVTQPWDLQKRRAVNSVFGYESVLTFSTVIGKGLKVHLYF